MRSLYSQSEVHLLCGNGLIKFMVNNQPFNDDEMWSVGENGFIPLLFALRYVEIRVCSSQVLGRMARPLWMCFRSSPRATHWPACPERGLLSEAERLRWPQEAGHYQAFSDPNYGGKVWNESGGPPRQPKPDPLSPITITATRHTHTQRQIYTTLSPWRAHAHTKSQHVSTLSFSLVIAIALTPAPPWPKRCSSIFSDSQRCTQLSNSLSCKFEKTEFVRCALPHTHNLLCSGRGSVRGKTDGELTLDDIIAFAKQHVQTCITTMTYTQTYTHTRTSKDQVTIISLPLLVMTWSPAWHADLKKRRVRMKASGGEDERSGEIER